jgi:hypothetical protein
MKINELFGVNDQHNKYSPRSIAKKQKAMTKRLQLKWAKDKKALAKQGKPTSVVDYINRALPVVSQTVPNFANRLPADPSWRDENKFIQDALNIALEKTKYWQRQIEKRAGMVPAAPAAPANNWAAQRDANWAKKQGTAWASKRNANWKGGQVTQKAPQQSAPQKPAPTANGTIPDGATVEYGNATYKWVNNAWRAGTERLVGDDATTATNLYWNPEQ